MTNQELMVEIRENRREIKRLHEDFFLFKGKAYGFIAVLSILINVGIAFINKL